MKEFTITDQDLKELGFELCRFGNFGSGLMHMSRRGYAIILVNRRDQTVDIGDYRDATHLPGIKTREDLETLLMFAGYKTDTVCL